MPDKKSSKSSGDDGGDAGKKSPIVAIVLCVAMLGAGYVVGGMMSGGSSETAVVEAAGDEAEVVEEHHELGTLHELDAINVNLQEGHFLRIAVALETHGSGGDGHGGEEEFPMAPAADLLLATFSGRTVEELSTAEGREEARTELLEAVVKKYDGEVYGLYFTEFVMQ